MKEVCIVYLLYAELLMIMVNRCYYAILTPNSKIHISSWQCSLIQFIIIFLHTILTGNMLPTHILDLLLMMPAFLLFEEKLKTRFQMAIIAFLVCGIAELVVGALSIVINSIHPQWMLIPNTWFSANRYKELFIYSCFVLLILHFLLKQLRERAKNKMFQLRMPWVLKLTLSMGLIIFFANFAGEMESREMLLTYLPLCLLISGFCLWLQITSLRDLEKHEKNRKKMELQRVQLEQRKVYFQKIEDQYQEIRKWNHDIANHLSALSWLMEQGESEKAEQYIDSLLLEKWGGTQDAQ